MFYRQSPFPKQDEDKNGEPSPLAKRFPGITDPASLCLLFQFPFGLRLLTPRQGPGQLRGMDLWLQVQNMEHRVTPQPKSETQSQKKTFNRRRAKRLLRLLLQLLAEWLLGL